MNRHSSTKGLTILELFQNQPLELTSSFPIFMIFLSKGVTPYFSDLGRWGYKHPEFENGHRPLSDKIHYPRKILRQQVETDED